MTYYIQQFRSPRGCLSYIVSDTETKEALIIDPSVEVSIKEYISFFKKNELKLQFIIETHTHADHISSAQKVKEETGAKILQHKNAPSHLKDRTLSEETLNLGNTEVRFLYTPGHTDDCICILIGDVVFTGDTLLIGGTGRTDFQNGSSQSLYNSIWKKLMTLSDSTKVYPAHNYKNQINSTIGNERENNPRLALSHDEFITAMDAHHPQKPDLFDIAIAENSK